MIVFLGTVVGGLVVSMYLPYSRWEKLWVNLLLDFKGLTFNAPGETRGVFIYLKWNC